MKYELEKYETYKEGDSPWFDQVPSHWINGRIKDFVDTNTITKIPTNLTDDDLVEFIPMTNVNDELGIIKKYDFLPLNEVSSGYTKFKNKDIIFAKITPCMENGNCAIVDGLTYNICFGSTEFIVFRASQKLLEKYLHYFLHNESFRRNAEPFMKGTAGQKRISNHYLATHFFALPPLKEQQFIVDYLDTKITQINCKIDILTQKATKYSQLKQSLINETVTHGLDKTGVMKDSEVNWIGEIPEHWEVKRGKDVFVRTKNKVGIESSLYDVLSLTLKGVIKRDLDNMKGKIPESFDGYQIACPDNLVFCLFDMDVTPRIVGYVYQCGIITSAYTVLKRKKDIYTKYFLYYFLEQNRNGSLLANSKTLRSTMTFDMFSQLRLPVPPYEEQKSIANYLEEKTAKIDSIVETINTQIDKLKELRKTLINDVVTSKIKVTMEGDAV